MALSVTPEGAATAYGLAPANCDERCIGDALIAEDLYDTYLANKGFSSVLWEKRWREEHGALVAATPQRTARRAWPDEACRQAAGIRQIIEGVIWQLKDLFGLEHHRAKTLSGLLTRLAAKTAVYTCGMCLTFLLGRPLRHLADLFLPRKFVEHRQLWLLESVCSICCVRGPPSTPNLA